QTNQQPRMSGRDRTEKPQTNRTGPNECPDRVLHGPLDWAAPNGASPMPAGPLARPAVPRRRTRLFALARLFDDTRLRVSRARYPSRRMGGVGRVLDRYGLFGPLPRPALLGIGQQHVWALVQRIAHLDAPVASCPPAHAQDRKSVV